MSYTRHQSESKRVNVRCIIVTFSDTRTAENDTGGALLARLVVESGHTVVDRRMVREDRDEVESQMRAMLSSPDIDVVLTTGGTGIARRDITIDAIEKLLDRPLPGFGELFRMLSFQQVGSGAMLSRAIAGIAGGKVIFCLPGSPAAIELGFGQLIGPELGHLIRELQK